MVEEALEEYLPGEDMFPREIVRAFRYSVFAGGKRLRPILCMAAAEAVGGTSGAVMPAACAVELLHTYSLIHDDLPAMDDDDFRRGKPSCHRAFGEALAILAGDALLTEAFRLMAEAAAPSGRVLRVIREVADAAGWRGMVGGQVVDLNCGQKEMNEDTLHYIHTHKTGALIAASVRAGAILAGARVHELSKLTAYGNAIGLAFQIADDILDAETDQHPGGGTEESSGRITYPGLYGIAASKAQAKKLAGEAAGALKGFDTKAQPLRAIAHYIVEREE
jgi:geranylgeranyl diphosphate synthase, type II